MQTKARIAVEHLDLQPFTAYDPEGILLVSGTAEKANPMTISWGMFGIMWNRPVAMVMVRPTRYTWDFICNAPDFTLNWLAEDLYEALYICGNQSGRDIDKWATAKLHAEKGLSVNSPVVAESILSLECRTLYREDLNPEKFLENRLEQHYPVRDYHRLFIGEVVAASGIERFRRPQE